MPQNTLPKVYREPKPVFGVDAVIELSSITLKYDGESVLKTVYSILHSSEYKFNQIITPYQSGVINANVPNLGLENLFDIYNVLCSCKVFISLNSGSHSVAAAAMRHNPTMLHYCILPAKDYDWITKDAKFIFPGIQYIIEGNEV